MSEGPDPDWIPMREGDLDEVLEIERAAYPNPWNREHFLHELRDQPSAECRVAIMEGRVVAYACYWLLGDELQLNNLAVAMDRRMAGLGTTCLKRVLAHGAMAGCRRATIEVRAGNEVAIALYRRAGFREDGRRRGLYAREGEDGVLMSRALDGGAIAR